MKNQFIASSIFPLAYPATFALLALGLCAKGFGSLALIMLLLAFLSIVFFAYNFRIYVITDIEFYTANLLGSKSDTYLFDDMVKIYTLKGYSTNYRPGIGTIDYAGVVLKIQMKNGQIFQIDIDEVLSGADFIDALREKLDEHVFEVL